MKSELIEFAKKVFGEPDGGARWTIAEAAETDSQYEGDDDKEARRGFTLIEVMVAISILAISMTAIVGINVGSARATPEIKFYVIATQLARLKMIEFEAEMKKKGYSQFEEADYDGDFSDIDFDNWKWKAHVSKVELKLPSNMGTGENEKDKQMAGFMGYATIITDIIKASMREVKITVYLDDPDSDYKEEMSVSTHLIDPASAGGQTGTSSTSTPTSTQTPQTNPTGTTPYTSPFTGPSTSPFKKQ